ncbi:MAG: type I restriction enzyme S subunit [Polaribacter sp.]|jgi:type I restriction enzyme S subunit
MSKKKKIIPELRFSEFQKSGEWEYLNGNKLFEPISNKKHNSDLPILAITQEQGAIPRELINYHVSVSEKSVESYKVIEVGDFIISLRSFQGGIEYSNYLGLCSPAYIILRKKVDDISDFYRHYFKSSPFIQDLNRNLEGIRDGKMVSYKQFSEILIPKPKKPEQQKIASCLTSLDDLIAAHNDKLDAIKDHKKGLMHNLSPQEGQKVSNYHFPEFENHGEWEEKELNQLGELINGLTYSPKDLRDEGLLVLRSSNVQNGIIDFNDRVFVRPDVKGANLSEPNDILVCVRNGSKRLIGKNALIPKDIPLATHGAFMTVFRAKHPEFVFQLFQSEAYDKQVKAGLGATINSINGKNFLKYEFLVPKNPKEQQKIASCLSAVDELITAQSDKIEQLQQHKKGLIQGLFPKIES